MNTSLQISSEQSRVYSVFMTLKRYCDGRRPPGAIAKKRSAPGGERETFRSTSGEHFVQQEGGRFSRVGCATIR